MPDRELEARILALESANRELTRCNAELDRFAHTVAHDLKEPLRGVRHLVDFLREDCGDQLSPEGQDLIDRIYRVADRMKGLLDALLELARVGGEDVASEPVDLGIAVERALEPLQPRIGELGIEVRIPRPLPTVHCAAVRAEQVFANLLSNAVKYGPERGAWIEIGWAESDPGPPESRIPGSPVLYVRDNGIGIPKDQHENVFRIFKRLHPREAYGGGTGVGLSIVRRIVEDSGGQLRIDSAPGLGAAFWFAFGGPPR